MSVKDKLCENCQQPLRSENSLWICDQCNSEDVKTFSIFKEDKDTDEYIFIECPGATLYEDGTNTVKEGVEFTDRNDPSKGHRIVGKPIFPPTHKKKRRIKKEAYGKITRCQACQDYTVRMRRREGVDFFIPSTKYPNRKKLKQIQHVSYEP